MHFSILLKIQANRSDWVDAVAESQGEEEYAQVLESHSVIFLGTIVSVVLVVNKVEPWENSQKFVLKMEADILNFCYFQQLNTKSYKAADPNDCIGVIVIVEQVYHLVAGCIDP